MGVELLKSGSSVSVIGTTITGVTVAVSADGPNNDNIEYKVIWWANGERKSQWMHDFEIELHKPKKQAGFKTYPANDKPLIDRP